MGLSEGNRVRKSASHSSRAVQAGARKEIQIANGGGDNVAKIGYT
jgi:hypothetical protein